MRKQWFYRLLWSYLPMFFIVASFLILITFLTINRAAQEETRRANEVLARHIMQTIDAALKPIDQLLVVELQGDTKLTEFFRPNPPNSYMAELTAAGRLKELANASPLIDSIYLYRYRDRQVLTNQFKTPIETFGDAEYALGWAEQEFHPAEWSGRREYVKFQGRESTEVVSLVRRVPLLSGEQGLVVLNVKLDGLRRIIEEMTDSSLSTMRLLDAEGRPMLGEKGEPGTLAEASADKELSRVASDYTGWAMRGGIRNETFFTFVSAFSYAWVFVQLCVVVLGIVWIVYVTRRNYRPIELIMETMQRFVEKKSHLFGKRGKLDEFAFIENALQKLMERSADEAGEEALAEARRRRLFQTLLDEGDLEPLRAELALASFRSGTMLLIDLDRYPAFAEQYSKSDQHLLKYALQCVVRESAEAASQDVWTEWIAPSRLAALCMPKPDAPAGAETAAATHALCDSVRRWVEVHLAFTVTLGFGSASRTFSGLAGSFAEAGEALKLKLRRGDNRVFGPEEVRAARDAHEPARGLSAVQAIARAFKTGDKQWKGKLESVFAEMRSGAYEHEEIHHTVRYLILQLHGELTDLPEEYQRTWKQDVFPKLRKVVDELETLDRLERIVVETLTETAEHLHRLRQNSGYAELIREAQRYIDEHFASPELSLALLSENFDINPNYLSKLFKECVGENFVDYVIRVRMERAKQLLEADETPVQQVAEQVGYTHAVSFIRIFKRTVGVTPGDYRKKLGLPSAI